MNKASVLVLTGREGDVTQLQAVSAVAAKHDLHLSVLVLGRLPQLPIYATGMGDFAAMTDYRDWQQEIEKEAADLDASADGLRHYLADQKLSYDVSVLSADPTTFPEALARRALTNDLVALTNDMRADRDLFHDAVRAALFRAPVGVLLNGLSVKTPLQPKRILVGWNSGLPASRAIRSAIPLLKQAEEVTVAMFDPVMTIFRDGENPGSDVAHWLTRQGCTVSVQQQPSGGMEIAQCLAQCARETEADLIVMGAYDHSRMRQIVFGGTTQSMIEQADMAVLLAH